MSAILRCAVCMYVCMCVSTYVVRWFGRDHGTSGPARTSMVLRQHRPVDACQIRKVTACADLVHRRGPDQSMAGVFVLIVCRSSATGDLFLSRHGPECLDEKGLITTPQGGLDPFCWCQHGSQGASIGCLCRPDGSDQFPWCGTTFRARFPGLFQADLETGCNAAGLKSFVPLLLVCVPIALGLGSMSAGKQVQRTGALCCYGTRQIGSETDDPRCQ